MTILKRQWILFIGFLVMTLFTNAIELEQKGWNLILVCQDINRVDINMTI